MKEAAGIEYFSFGKGNRNLVIIPGLAIHSVMGLAELVTQAYQIFAEEYTVWLFDRPKEMQDGCTIRELAEETAGAMKELGFKNTSVLGISQGGMMAQYLAIDHPELVGSMVLGSTLSGPNDTFLSVVNKWLRLTESRDEKGLIEAFLEDVFSGKTLEEYRDALIRLNMGITEEEYRRLEIQERSCLSFDCRKELSAIRCPVLVLGARKDRIVTPAAAEETAAALGCELYIYEEDYGHAVYDEAPDYKQRCKEFFDKW